MIKDQRILGKIHQCLRVLYGEDVHPEVLNRLNLELQWYQNRLGLDYADKVATFLEERKKQGGYVVPRLWANSSFVLYLLGASTVNPLPRHHHCPHGHVFAWGENDKAHCPQCGEPLIEDGFDLDFIFFADAMDALPLNYLGEEEKHEDLHLQFFPGPNAKELLQEATRLGLTQQEIETDVPADTMIKILAHMNHREEGIQDGLNILPTLSHPLLLELVDGFYPHSIDFLAELASACHGRGVIEGGHLRFYAGKLPLDHAYSRESLFRLLQEKGFDSASALSTIKELYRNYDGRLSEESEQKLRSLGIEESFIDALKQIHYLYFKGDVIAELRLELRLAQKLLFLA